MECYICYEGGEGLCTTPCRHTFHKKCLRMWSVTCKKEFKDITCPVCRFVLRKQCECPKCTRRKAFNNFINTLNMGGTTEVIETSEITIIHITI